MATQVVRMPATLNEHMALNDTAVGPLPTIQRATSEDDSAQRQDEGNVYIQATFKDTTISITDSSGTMVFGDRSSRNGSTESHNSALEAVQTTAKAAAQSARENGLRLVKVFVKGPGAGCEAAIRALEANGLQILVVADVTPIPHNGCRPPRRRRI